MRQLLETHGTRISVPDDRNFETEGEAIESGLRRTVEGRDVVMRDLIRAVYRFRDAALVAEKKDDFGNAPSEFVPGTRACGGGDWTGNVTHRVRVWRSRGS
ncbi:MAG TPA: hypothetical protein VHS80_08215 [Chthoniobacterales bacterium]|nr:hypothetical protein [Chthoniobacterales bacterium]